MPTDMLGLMLMTRLFAVFLLAFATMAPAPAQAYDTDKEKFTAAISDPEYSQRLMNVLSALMQRNGITCHKQSSMRRSTPTTLQRIKFRGEGDMPTSGRWQEIIFLQGCGERTQLNFLVSAEKDGSLPTIVPLVPGLTEVNPINQAEAVNKALMYAQTADPKCVDMFVAYSRFYKWRNLSMSDKSIHPWFEKWYVDVCGKEQEIIMQFIPDEAFNMFKIQAELNPNYDPDADKDEKAYQSDYDDY